MIYRCAKDNGKFTKTSRAPCRKRQEARGDNIHLPRKFGDATATDLKVFTKENYTVVVQDLTKNKTAQEMMDSLQKFVPPHQKHRIIQTDYSLQFVRACEDLCWKNDRSTPIPIKNQRTFRKHTP